MICYKQAVFLSFVDDRLRTVLDDRAHVIDVLLIRKIRGRFFQNNVKYGRVIRHFRRVLCSPARPVP